MLIGLSGQKRSGKDTVYGMMKLRLHTKLPGILVQKYAFADEVKRYAKEYFNVDLENTPKESYRYILQGIGEMMRNEVSETYWINKVLAKYGGELPSLGVITDVRYPNEVETILQHGGKVLRITRDMERNDTHPSEIALSDDDFSDIIDNSGTMEQLKMKVIEWTDRVLMPVFREEN